MPRLQRAKAHRSIGLFLERLEPRLLLTGNQVTAVVDDQVFVDDIADGASSRQTLDFPILVSVPRQFASRDTVYNYKIGEADEVNCQHPQGYSAWQDSSENLQYSLADYADGTNIKLCLRGSVSPGPIQSPNNATVYEWTKVIPPPEAFSILGPLGLTSDSTATVQWEAAANADSYDVVVSSDATCTIPVQSYVGLPTTSVELASLADGTYFTCVVAGNTGGTTPASNTGLRFIVDTVPKIDLEKFTRVDINPIDIEKLVRVEGPGFVGDVCDVLGKPVELTFEYIPSNTFNLLQPIPSKANIIVNNGPDDDDTAYVIVSDKISNPLSGNVFFQGTVSTGDTFTASGGFGSNTFIYFYDSQGGPLLQEVQYHTSCSAPIILGAQPLSGKLVGYVGQNGAAQQPDLGPGVGDDDADSPTGPKAVPGDTVVFTFVVTNPIPGTQLSDIMVTDQLLAPDANAIPPVISPVEEGGFNVGDTDPRNGLLNFGEMWLYTSTVGADDETLPTQYVDKATVTGIPVDANGAPIGGQVLDMDPAHYVVPATPPVQGDVCAVLGKPVALTFQYIPGTTVDTVQAPGKAYILPGSSNAEDSDEVSFVVVTDQSNAPMALNGGGRQFFRGNVAFGATFTANEMTDNFGSQTYIHFFENDEAGLLQSITYHTSCSQPITLGDVIGNATLVAYEGETGSGALPPTPDPVDPVDLGIGGVMLSTDDPFDPANIGVPANDPTGPVAQLGNKITWTYVLTNPGGVSLTVDKVVDDGGTPIDPSDDFMPVPVLDDEGFNVGDTDQNNLLDPPETWYYQAMKIATEPGQYCNIGTVFAKGDGQDLSDFDQSCHIVNPLVFETYVFVPPVGGDGDLCPIYNKPTALTFEYDPSDVFNPLQPIPNKANIVVNNGIDDDDNIYVIVSGNSTDPTSGDVFFEGNVTDGEQFTASAAIAGSFSANIYIYFYDEQGGPLLQQVQYHTSCSAPIILGAELLGATLVGYVGETGVVMGGNLGDPADTPPGPSFVQGDEVVFKYAMTNRGNVSLTNIQVTDSVLGNVTEVVDDGDGDDNLEPGETWVLQASMIATVPGQQENVGTATANSVQDPTGPVLTATDPAFHFVETFSGDLCPIYNKPTALTFEYDPSDVFNPLQPIPNKANIVVNNGIDDDDNIYVIVSGNSTDPTSGDVFFEGNVTDGEQFTASAAIAGSFSANIYIYFYDEQGGPLLQQVQYHTSCSAPIILGAELLSATLVGYVGETGVVMGGNLGDPADTPPGPSFVQGDEVVFKYAMTNRGNVSLTNIQVTDSVLGNVTEVVDDGDGDDNLEPGETWVLQASMIATVPRGDAPSRATAIAFVSPTADGGAEGAYVILAHPSSGAFADDARTDTHYQHGFAVTLPANATAVQSLAARFQALDEFFADDGDEVLDEELLESLL